MIPWKHPELTLEIAKRLQADRYTFDIDIIDDGVLTDSLLQQIKEERLEEKVHLLGSMPQEEVRKHMEAADIFLFTSDYNEGWGAVLNEAMNSGCAAVASHAIGAAPFLIQHGENGMLYKNGDTDSLYTAVKQLCDNRELRIRIGTAAYYTITNTWNAEVATQRLLELYNIIENKKENPFSNGPCSIARPIPQRKMYQYAITKKDKI